MTVTPVAKAPSALRKSVLLKPSCATVGSTAACCIARPPSHLCRAYPDLAEPLLDHAVEVLRRPHRLCDEAAEGVALHREQGRRRHSPDGGHPWGVPQDRHLPEELAAGEGGELPRLPVVLANHLDLAVDDDEELVRRCALTHDDVAGRHL